MTKYDDQVECRCPECGTPVQLSDVRCPRCDRVLPFGYNVERDRQSLFRKYDKLPRWARACCLGFTLALLISAIVFDSGLCFLISTILLIMLMILGKRSFIKVVVLAPLSLFSETAFLTLCNMYAAEKPWDKTLLEADNTINNSSSAN